MVTGTMCRKFDISDFVGNAYGQAFVGSQRKSDLQESCKEDTADNENSISNDPIFEIWGQIDKQSLPKLAAEFIKDTVVVPVTQAYSALINSNDEEPTQESTDNNILNENIFAQAA